MKLFDNFKLAHEHFNFQGTHRIGALHNNDYIIRIYSNSVSKPDYFNRSKTLFYYTLKSKKVKDFFLNNKKSNKLVDVFTKDLQLQKVVYHGKFKVVGIRNNSKHVLLKNH